MATPGQIGKIQYLRKSCGLDYEDILNKAEDIVSRSVNSLEDLTTEEASKLIEDLEDDFGS